MKTKIFLAWSLTVVAGSLFLPFLFFVRESYSNLASSFGLALIALVVSTLLSLPTLIALLIVAHIKRENEDRIFWKWIHQTHIIMFILTCLCFFSERKFISITCFYALIAIFVWWLIFRKDWKAIKTKTRYHE